ncbi:MAG: FAD:protein FMN transferase, partial [Eubacterium sp.]
MKKIISIFTAFALALVCCSCSAGSVRANTKYSTSFLDLFDTASTVIAYDTSQKAFDAHYEQFYNKLAEYDRLYDIYKSYDGINNLYTLNKKAKDGPVKVDSRIID